jgi:hypothetical protein
MAQDRSSKRLGRWLFVVVAFIVFIVMLPRILQQSYGLLVVNQSIDGCRLAMVMHPTPECFDVAAELVNEGIVDEVLLVDQRVDRTVRVGAIPPLTQLWHQDLAERDVMDSRIRVIQTDAMTAHKMFRELDTELGHQLQQDHCIVVSTSTLSRHAREMIDQALSPARATEFRVIAVEPEENDSLGWWRSRRDVSRVLNHGLHLAFVLCQGESDVNQENPYEHLESS